MDNAVALVQAYLRVNGYFTVSEYPVLEATRAGGYQAVTDLDILAFRFSGAGQHPAGWRGGRRGASELVLPDPALGISPGQSDMLVGEVKEGRAVLNAAATNPEVLHAALVRFGCEPPADAERTVTQLLRAGHATLSNGHRLRLVAFGATVDEEASRTFHVVRLGQVVDFLRRYLIEHWENVRQADGKDQALGFLLLLEKAARGAA